MKISIMNSIKKNFTCPVSLYEDLLGVANLYYDGNLSKAIRRAILALMEAESKPGTTKETFDVDNVKP